MTDDSFVHVENVQDKNVDPLTAPFWPVVEGEEVLLDPEMAPEPAAVEEPTWINTSAPQPPSVDQILRGEYTGWVPIIKAGESLQDAEDRAEAKLDRIEAAIEFEDTISTVEILDTEIRPLPSEILEPLAVTPPVSIEVPVRKATAWTNLVEDPDTAKSPAAALEEARARIQAMRDSLQYNIRRVSESFEHPIFDDVAIDEPNVTLSVEDSSIDDESPAPSPVVAEEIEIPSIVPEAKVTSTPPVVETPQVAAPTIVIDAPAREYVTSAPIGEAVAEPKAPDTSLELMIMRDEIKDLRTRLDASQKLIEDLMHRLTNLTELALKSRQN
jgi:hypothetical protein